MGPPNRPTKEVRKQGGHAEHLPFQLSPRRGPLIDDAFRRQQAVADKALFPKYLGKRRGQVLKTGQEIGFSEYLSSGLLRELFTSSGYELFLVPVQKRASSFHLTNGRALKSRRFARLGTRGSREPGSGTASY
ncbi:unnamed protein product [Ilex paraguariensis]|uniref:Uncharacterized protein n=2 Tax=Ilex paraguariensis TaxID=185542 RepID=A0ABC8TNT4_9AQUA